MDKSRMFGPYRVETLLGRGGMGEVHRAYDTRHDRYVALKWLTATTDDEFRTRFRREANIVARLTEPHVIPIHAYGEIGGRLYLDMRLVDGADLGRLLDENGPLPPHRAVAILAQVAAALDAAHGAGLVHRDVKPSNILVTERDFTYLIDFGLAASTAGMTSLTRSGTVIGTMDYLAPERLNQQPVDGRADMYSLACVLYQAVTGHRPFPTDEPVGAIAAHLHTPPPVASALAPHLPAALDQVIATGMAKDPDRRYATAGQLMAAATVAVVSGNVPSIAAPTVPVPTEPVPAPPRPTGDPPAQPHPPGRGRRTLLLVAAVLAILAITTGTVVAVLLIDRDDSAQPGPTTPSSVASTSKPTIRMSTPSTSTASTVPTTSATASPDVTALLQALPRAYRGHPSCQEATPERDGDELAFVSCTASNVGDFRAGNRDLFEPDAAHFRRFANAEDAVASFVHTAESLGLHRDDARVSCIAAGHHGTLYGENTSGAGDFLTCYRSEEGAEVLWVAPDSAMVGRLVTTTPQATIDDMEGLYLWWNSA